jgi:hypothetical protein
VSAPSFISGIHGRTLSPPRARWSVALSVLVQMLVLLLLLSLLSFLTVFDDCEDMVFEYLSIAVTSEL